MTGSALSGAFRTLEGKESLRSTALLRNATRIQQALSRLKGAPMKVGQMLSLHEGLLPPEVASVFRALQDQAPPIPMGKISAVLKGELGDQLQLVEEVDPDSCAAASIGQIHRARLKDGRDVVFKVQYPGIDETIEADLKTLKGILQLVLSWYTKADTEAVWSEVRDRLREEIDYRHEASNLNRMRDLWAQTSWVHIPRVVEELSSQRVLCMESLTGLSGDEACAETVPQALRDQWGQHLFQFMLTGLLQHRLLHADPNLANFAFAENGDILVYDFGCLKEIPPPIATSYARLTRSVLSSRYGRIAAQLQRLGIENGDGSPVSQDIVDALVAEVRPLIRRRPPYRFGDDDKIYARSMDLGVKHWREATGLRFPAEIVFIHRTFAGQFGNLCKLRACGPWRDIAESALPDG